MQQEGGTRRISRSKWVDPDAEIQFPAIVIEKLEGAVCGAQFFPRERKNVVSVGYTIVTYNDRYRFDDITREAKEIQEHEPPEWREGAYYLKNYFGMLWGPLDATTDDEAFAEAKGMLLDSGGADWTWFDRR